MITRADPDDAPACPDCGATAERTVIGGYVCRGCNHVVDVPAPAGASPNGRAGVLGVAFARTDTGNAELVAHLYGDRLRFDHRRARWLVWDKHRWRPDSDGAAMRLAVSAARRRYEAALGIDDLREREAEAKWAIASEARPRLEAALAIASALPPITDAGASFDRDPFLLGVENGVVDLRTGTLRRGRPDDMITRRVPIPYNPDAKAPRFERFITEVFEDAALIDFITRAVGYSLTGETSEQCLFLCIGGGSNGKSTFLGVLRLIGGEYAHNAPFSTFELAQRQTIPADLAEIDGRRIVTSSETTPGARLNEARLKALTGGDPITARPLYGGFFEFVPQCKIWLATNHKPRVSDLSYAFWRRVRLIPFMRKFEGKAVDQEIGNKLRAEAPGILAWAVRGCLEWQRRGLEPPALVVAATEEFRRESDPLGDFLAECCTMQNDAITPAGDLYAAYLAWAQREGLRERETLSRTAFGRRISETFEKGRDGRGRITYTGIGLMRSEGFRPDFVFGRRVNPPIRISLPTETPSRDLLKKPFNPSDPSEADMQTFVCTRCGTDDLAYDDAGRLYCPACRRELDTLEADP